MFSKERQAIDGLFKHIREVAEKSGPREAQAEALIDHHMQRIPGASYYLAQIVLVQRQALVKAEQQLAELERQRGAAPGSFAPPASGSGYPRNRQAGATAPGSFAPPASGSGYPRNRQAGATAPGSFAPPASGSAYPRNRQAGATAPAQRQQGFLEGAAQTAVGVGGGILMAGAAMELARGIFGSGDVAAADMFDAHSVGYEEAVEDVGIYEAGYEDAGFDMGDDLSGGDLDFGFDDW